MLLGQEWCLPSHCFSNVLMCVGHLIRTDRGSGSFSWITIDYLRIGTGSRLITLRIGTGSRLITLWIGTGSRLITLRIGTGLRLINLLILTAPQAPGAL